MGRNPITLLLCAAVVLTVGCADRHPAAPALSPVPTVEAASQAGALPFPALASGRAAARASGPGAGSGIRTSQSSTNGALEVLTTRSLNAFTKTLTFEGGLDANEVRPPHIAGLGVELRDWLTVIDQGAGGSGDFANEPSPSTIGFWRLDGGCMGRPKDEDGLVIDSCAREREIRFNPAVSKLSLYYTSAFQVTLTAFAGEVEVGTVTGAPNLGMGSNATDAGSYNLFTPLELSTATDVITSVRMTGYVNATGIDNLTVVRANAAPVARPGGPYHASEGGTVSFDGTATSDPEDGVVGLTYAWNFGDGGTAAGPTPAHPYAESGTYTVTLKVTDANGKESSTNTVATIANLPPAAALSVAPQAVQAGGSFAVSLGGPSDPSSVDVAAGFQYAFDCGSGSFGPLTSNASTACTAGPAGTLTVRGKIEDEDGGSTSYSAVVTVLPPPPAPPTPQQIVIEVHPESIKLKDGDGKGGTVSVHVRATGGLDPSKIKLASVTLGNGSGSETPLALHPNGAPHASVDAKKGVFHFRRSALIANQDLVAGQTALVFRANLQNGQPVQGTDQIRVIP